MKTNYSFFKVTLFTAMVVMIGLLTSEPANAQAWYDADWQYRQPVTVTNEGATALSDFQVQITLGASFEFANANSDGSDIRITDTDGTTLIPFWIESWDEPQADIWVKIPSVPTGVTTVYNIMGQEVVNTSFGDVLTKIAVDKIAYYVVKVVSDEGVVAKKVFVK